MNKTETKRRKNPEAFGRIAFTIAFALVGVAALVFYFVPFFQPYLIKVGSIFSSLNKVQLVDNPDLEGLYYARVLCIDLASFLPIIGIVWMRMSCKIPYKLSTFLIVVFILLMVGIDVATYAIPTSSLRSLPIKTELEDYKTFFINWRYTARFFANFSGVYAFYGFPVIMQFFLTILVFIFTNDYHKGVTYFFIALLFFIIETVGFALVILIVALLSGIGMAAIAIAPTIIFFKVLGDGEIGGSSSDSKVYVGPKAGYASNDSPVYEDGKGGYVFSDGRPYTGIVHCYPD